MKESAQSRRAVKFGVFEADFTARELRKNGTKIRLQDQPFQVLALLLENPGQVVTRAELRQKLWSADTFVDLDNGLNTCINKIREALGDTAEKPRFVETLPRREYRFIGAQPTVAGGAARQIESLVVLPLANLSRDPEQEYFAEGMTEALITTMAKIGALRVVSRTTAMHYKGVHRPLREIAGELQVDAVVEGTVLRAGDRVRISAQLIDARTDGHLWAENYERDMRDVLGLQAEVAQAIAREIQVKLTPQEQAILATARAVNPDAYELYLKGRYHWNRRCGHALEKAAGYFQDALEKDPRYAAAYAGLADCANINGLWWFVSPEQGCGKARELARKALEIDSSLSEAHSSLGFSLLFYDYDFLGAEREFRRALELNPQNVTAGEWYATFLGIMGCFDQSIGEIMRAVRLDPLSPIIATVAGMLAYLARRYDQAIEMCRRALDLDANFFNARWTLAAALVQKGLHQAAIEEMEDVVRATNRIPLQLYMLGICYANAGRREDALGVLDELRKTSKQRFVPPFWSAMIYAGMNAKDEAFDCLEAAYRALEPWMALTKFHPWLDNLRSDPRFEELLRRMNFPP